MLHTTLLTISIWTLMLSPGITAPKAELSNERIPTYPTARQSEFQIEVLVNGVPLGEYHARGKRYVEAIQGEEYSIRLRNPLPVRVAVALSVDGLNTIDARRTTSWEASKWVLMPYETVTVGGWQMSSARARKFYFTSERDSYAAKIGRAAQLGLISAAFYPEREATTNNVTPPPPYGRPKERAQAESSASAPRSSARTESRRDSDSSSAGVADDEYAATGIGRSVRHDVSWVSLDLQSRPAAEISLRYEYREQLIRLGIVPRDTDYYNSRNRDPIDRRERATGFDAGRYSPEP